MARLIIGHTTDSSVKIWIRASQRWPIAYLELFDDQNLPIGIPPKTIETNPDEFFTSVMEFKSLKPETRYKVKVSFAQSKASAKNQEFIKEAYTNGSFTTFAAKSKSKNFSFLFGSCNLHSLGLINNPDRAWIEVSKLCKEAQASFMIHCGDQIYADIPFNPPIDIDHYRRKYLDAWEDCKPAQKTLTELTHYMILDDHEIDNNFDRSKKDHSLLLLNPAMKAYWEFQHSHNPTREDGVHYHYHFEYGSAKFFVMDTRYYRNSKYGEILDRKQEKEFLQWLLDHKHHPKFIVTSVPFVGEVVKSDGDKWCDPAFAAQRLRIINHIAKHNISKIVFLTGDMHTSYHAHMTISKSGGDIVIHELMSSPINQSRFSMGDEDEYRLDPVEVRSDMDIHVETQINQQSLYTKKPNIMQVNVEFSSSEIKVEYKIHRTTESSLVFQGGFLVQ